MSKSIKELESLFPISVGEVTFTKLEDPTLLYFTLEGDDTEHCIDWMFPDEEEESSSFLNIEDYKATLDLVDATIRVANMKENILRPWYFAVQGL
jgi:hypothetical protein